MCCRGRVNSHLGELGSGSSGHLLDPQAQELCLKVIELLGQLLLVLRPQFGALDFNLQTDKRNCALILG